MSPPDKCQEDYCFLFQIYINNRDKRKTIQINPLIKITTITISVINIIQPVNVGAQIGEA